MNADCLELKTFVRGLVATKHIGKQKTADS